MARNDINLPALISPLRGKDIRLYQALMELHRRTGASGGSSLVDQVADEVSTRVGLVISTVSFTTAALATVTQEEGSINTLKDVSNLLTITADQKCFIILYTSQDARDADVIDRPTMPTTTDPDPGIGILAEFRFSLGGEQIEVSPPVLLYGLDGTAPSTQIWYRILNEETSTENINVTMMVVGLV